MKGKSFTGELYDSRTETENKQQKPGGERKYLHLESQEVFVNNNKKWRSYVKSAQAPTERAPTDQSLNNLSNKIHNYTETMKIYEFILI